MTWARGLLGRRYRLAVLLAVAAGLLALLPQSAAAQRYVGNPCEGEKVNSRECVCHNVNDFAFVPMKQFATYDDPGDGDALADEPQPAWEDAGMVGGGTIWDRARQRWISNGDPLYVAPWGTEPMAPSDTGPAPEYDVVLVTNDRYNELCAFSYFRENLRRLWAFAVALSGTLAAMSLAWAGVAYMQESASYGQAARIRMAMFRVGLGLLVVSLALVVWDIADGYLIAHVDSFDWNQQFYDSG